MLVRTRSTPLVFWVCRVVSMTIGEGEGEDESLAHGLFERSELPVHICKLNNSA